MVPIISKEENAHPQSKPATFVRGMAVQSFFQAYLCTYFLKYHFFSFKPVLVFFFCI